MPQGLDECGPVREGSNPQDDPADEKAVDDGAVHQIVDRQAHGNAAADQEGGDGREEGPKKPETTVAERMIGIGWPPRPAERDTEQHLVGGVGE